MIMEIIIGWIFRFWAYVFFGFAMEIKVTALSKVTDGDITEEDKNLHGYISLWMIPVYGILLLFIFEFVHGYIETWNFVFRYIVWCLSFTAFEALAGWFYDKVLHVRPWDYRKDWGSIFNGYTKLTYIPLWGIAGLIIEQYSRLLIFLTPYACDYFQTVFEKIMSCF